MIQRTVILFFLSCSILRAEALEQGIKTFRLAYQNWNSAQLWNASRDFRKAAASKPNSATAHTWLGTAHFHRLQQIESRPLTPKLQAAAAGDREDAIKALEKAVELDASQAEAQAMLAILYGMKIDGLLNGMRYGRLVQNHQKMALKHGAKNPRVQYLLGVGRLKTANDDDEVLEALKSLLLAEALYNSESQQDRADDAPAWGKDACLAFIGEAFLRLQKATKARDYFRKALEQRPNNQMAKAGLQKVR